MSTHQRAARGTVLALLKDLAAREQGLSVADACAALGLDSVGAYTRIRKSADQGHLHRAQRAGYKLHWFDTAERAQAWAMAVQSLPNANTMVENPATGPRLAAIGQPLKNRSRQPSQRPPLLTGSYANAEPNTEPPRPGASFQVRDKTNAAGVKLPAPARPAAGAEVTYHPDFKFSRGAGPDPYAPIRVLGPVPQLFSLVPPGVDPTTGRPWGKGLQP